MDATGTYFVGLEEHEVGITVWDPDVPYWDVISLDLRHDDDDNFDRPRGPSKHRLGTVLSLFVDVGPYELTVAEDKEFVCDIRPR